MSQRELQLFILSLVKVFVTCIAQAKSKHVLNGMLSQDAANLENTFSHTVLSNPRVISMKKNMIAQNTDPLNVAIASG